MPNIPPRPKFLFGDIVVVNRNEIGVVVKCWIRYKNDKTRFLYEIYVRNARSIIEYEEYEVDRYRVRHKELSEEELEWQNND